VSEKRVAVQRVSVKSKKATLLPGALFAAVPEAKWLHLFDAATGGSPTTKLRA
jgi:hypothetical protein